MLDSSDYATALEVARGMEEAGAYWLEEPFDGYDLQGPARLNQKEVYTFRSGEVQVPQGPGLGLDINEEAIERYRV